MLLSIIDWGKVWTVTIVGYLIVFAALVLLIWVFKTLPLLLNIKRTPKSDQTKTLSSKSKAQEISGEVNAAIAATLYLYFNELHDEESNVITIKRVTRNYSPWSSKLYGMNNILPPRR